MKIKTVVKRLGHEEKFDERKLYKTISNACFAAHMKRKTCSETSKKVVNEVEKWVSGKGKVTSNQIFLRTIKIMKKYDKNAAFMYETHRDIS